jgi:hypothetical protein
MELLNAFHNFRDQHGITGHMKKVVVDLWDTFSDYGHNPLDAYSFSSQSFLSLAPTIQNALFGCATWRHSHFSSGVDMEF